MTTSHFNKMAGATRLYRSLSLTLLSMLCVMSASADAPQPEADEGALPLPRWSEQELRTFRNNLPVTNGPGVLLPDNGGPVTDINELILSPISSGPRLDHLFDDRHIELSPRLRSEDMRLFLPESILGLPSQNKTTSLRTPTPLSSLREVTPEFLSACGQTLPQEYLIDPDLLVPEMQNHNMMRFLEFHARDARIKLHVLILSHDSKLPEGTELGNIASGSLRQTDACLLVYPLGEPWRARLFVSKSVHDQTSTEFLSETIQACMHEALQVSDAHDQLHSYAVHLSTRLFWLQKALGADPKVEAAQVHSLAEVTPTVKAPAKTSARVHSIVSWGSGGLLVLGMAAFAGRQFGRHLRFRRQNRVWILPEPETVPRLGGAFTGGGGGMIRYG